MATKTKAKKYKQTDAHKANRGEVSAAKYGSDALGYAIQVPGRVTTVHRATPEEFYGYIYEWLLQHYESVESAEERYQETFDLDWYDWREKLVALNELHALNEIRRANQRERLPLFVALAGANT